MASKRTSVSTREDDQPLAAETKDDAEFHRVRVGVANLKSVTCCGDAECQR